MYMCVVPFSRKTYIGTTGRGRRIRIATHVRSAHRRKAKQFFHKELARVGAHRGVWLTIYAWAVRQKVTDRLSKEGWFTYKRRPHWNVSGVIWK